MKSDAKTVEAYLAALRDDRREAITAVRGVILENLPEGYEEAMEWGMIAYQVPLGAYPDTYNGKPLMYAALASQKNHMGLYLCALYSMPGFREKFSAQFKKAGKKLDMGASCVRFKRLEDLPLKVVGETIAAVPLEVFIARDKEVHEKKG